MRFKLTLSFVFQFRITRRPQKKPFVQGHLTYANMKYFRNYFDFNGPVERKFVVLGT